VDNEPEISINPQTIINELQTRVNGLQGENIVLSAMVTELKARVEELISEESTEDGNSET
jgi:hypothetical protein